MIRTNRISGNRNITKKKLYIITAFITVAILSAFALHPAAEENGNPEETAVIWEPGELEDICMYHQFGLAVSKKGTLLAMAEARVAPGDSGNPHHICLKRSLDGGRTWEDETILIADYGEEKCSEKENEANGISGHCFANPTAVVDEATGRIFVFYSENFNNESSRLFYKQSDDDGLTWSKAVELTGLFADDPYRRPFHLPGPGHGIQLENSIRGRMAVTVWHRMDHALPENERKYGLSVLYSDDGGATWQNSKYMKQKNHENEGRIAEMPDGTLVINARSIDRYRYRSISRDGGITWSGSIGWQSIGEYGACDSGFVSELKDGYARLLTTHIENGTTVRNTLWAYLSYDEGDTWEYRRELWSDPSLEKGTGASDINVISDGVYGIVHGTSWDETQEVHFIRLRLSDLIGTDDETQVRHTHIYDDVNDGRCNLCGRIRITLLAFSGFMLVMILILVGLILCVKRR